MNYNNLDALIADNENFTEKPLDNSKNDMGRTQLTGTDWFKFNSKTVAYIITDGDGRIYLSDSTSYNRYSVLNVNQSDMAAWNTWRQEGTIGGIYKFVRVRWDGYSYYSKTSDECHLTFDVILMSNNRIYLYISDWPSDYNTGTCSLIWASSTGSSVTYTPTADGDKFTFIPADDNGTSWTVESGFNEPEYPDIRYLFRNSAGRIYSLKSGSPEVLTETALTAELFKTYGVDNLPTYSAYNSLGDLSILRWCEKDAGLSNEAIQTGQPACMDVDTGDIDINYNVNRIWVDADSGLKFQVSFNGGTTYKKYADGAWSDVTDDITAGNTAQEIHDIPMSEWQKMITDSKVRFRCRLTTTDQYLRYIQIGNQQDYEDVYGTDCPY